MDGIVENLDNKDSNNKKKRMLLSRLQLWLIVLLPTVCVALATWMYYTGSMIPVGRTNKGTLISPPVQLSSLALTDVNGQLFTDRQLHDEWGLLILVGKDCDTACHQVLNMTERVHLALNKNSDRVHRYALVTPAAAEKNLDIAPGFDHMTLLEMNAHNVDTALHKSGVAMDKTRMLIVDPLGNVMMSYKKGQDGKDVVKDFQRLLRASSIG